MVTQNTIYFKFVSTTVTRCNELCIDHQICYKFISHYSWTKAQQDCLQSLDGTLDGTTALVDIKTAITPKQSSSCTDFDAKLITIYDGNSHCIMWASFPKLLSMERSKSCVLKIWGSNILCCYTLLFITEIGSVDKACKKKKKVPYWVLDQIAHLCVAVYSMVCCLLSSYMSSEQITHQSYSISEGLCT